jgi:hypothetical protein
MIIYEDNQSTIQIAKNEGSTGRSKHIDLQFHFIRDRIKMEEVEVRYKATKEMTADLLTKSLNKDNYWRLAKMMGLSFSSV